MKNKILKALGKCKEIDYSDFNQKFEGCRHSSDTTKFEVEEFGMTIEVELTEHVMWDNHEWNEFDFYEVEALTVWDINGDEVDTDNITEEEILNSLKL